jgi:hypothetical protein
MVPLCAALHSNTVLTELDTSSHALSVESAHHVAEMLKRNTTLTSLSVGNSTLNDEVSLPAGAGLRCRCWPVAHAGP